MPREDYIRFRRGTSAEWVGVILGSGEPGWDTQTKLLKIGDGINDWGSLPSVGFLAPEEEVVHYPNPAALDDVTQEEIGFVATPNLDFLGLSGYGPSELPVITYYINIDGLGDYFIQDVSLPGGAYRRASLFGSWQNWERLGELPGVDQGSSVLYGETAGGAWASRTATPGLLVDTVVMRDASGRFQAQDPTGGYEVANKQYVDAQINALRLELS